MLKERITGSVTELFEGLDSVLEEADEERFISAIGLRTGTVQKNESVSNETAVEASAAAGLADNVAMSVKGGFSERIHQSGGEKHDFGEVLLRSLDVKGLIERLKTLLETLGIRNLYVLIDDFSELPQEAMQVVVDVLLAPLNNWSDEFIKFKVAAYPGRIYFGAIDKTKIDEVYLDLYTLYGGGDVARMEDSAIDFTRRLVTTRIRHFCSVSPEVFFESDSVEVWRQPFFASMANPRILGYILHFVHESHLIRARKIGTKAIQQAAERYYEEKVECYFHLGKFLHESFAERSSIYSLKELLESVLARARELRSHDSEVIRKVRGRHPTSHFHVPVTYETLFSTLELNFFMTKYFEMTDRSGRKVSVFALSYGLCSKYDIAFGRPTGEREFRLYFVERFFDYSPLVLAYLTKNQEIVCDNPSCAARFSYDQLQGLQMYGMLCAKCKRGTVRVNNLSRKYAAEIDSVNQDLLLPPAELGILQTLHVERKPMRPASIAGELDCSYQLVGWRGKSLSERGLVKRYRDDLGQRLLEISSTAEAAYFSRTDNLDVSADADPAEKGSTEA